MTTTYCLRDRLPAVMATMEPGDAVVLLDAEMMDAINEQSKTIPDHTDVPYDGPPIHPVDCQPSTWKYKVEQWGFPALPSMHPSDYHSVPLEPECHVYLHWLPNMPRKD